MSDSAQQPALLTTSEVATLFQVAHRTVVRWAKRGLIPCFRTPTGMLRFPRDQVLPLLQAKKEGWS